MLILNSHVRGILRFFACTEFLRKRVKHFIPIKNKMIRCPKNVGRLISEYVDRKKKDTFFTTRYLTYSNRYFTDTSGVCVSLEEWGARIFEPHDKQVLRDAKRGCEKQKNGSTVPTTLERSFHSLQQTYPAAKY